MLDTPALMQNPSILWVGLWAWGILCPIGPSTTNCRLHSPTQSVLSASFRSHFFYYGKHWNGNEYLFANTYNDLLVAFPLLVYFPLCLKNQYKKYTFLYKMVQEIEKYWFEGGSIFLSIMCVKLFFTYFVKNDCLVSILFFPIQRQNIRKINIC